MSIAVSRDGPATLDQRSAETSVADAGVSIIIPAYNEERAISGCLTELGDVLDQVAQTIPIEVLVVDDGSSDATASKVEPFVSDRLRLLRHRHNRGYGAAIKTGVTQAQYPWVLITDSDGTYPNRSIPELVARRGENEMVVGARTGPRAAIPWMRRPAKWFLRVLASRLSGSRIPDLNSGMRLMRKDLLKRYAHILPNAFSYTTTITLILHSAGFRVEYVPIEYMKREGRSKIRPLRDTVGFLQLVVRTVTLFDPLRVFIPLAAFFVGLSVLVGFGSLLLLGKLMDVVTVVLFVTGVQLLGMGVLADVVNRRMP